MGLLDLLGKQPATPDWRTRALEDFSEYVFEHLRVLVAQHVALTSAHVVASAVEAAAAEEKAKSEGSSTDERKATIFQDAAVFARQEIDDGLPLTHAQMTVTLWSAFEDAIRTLVFDHLSNDAALWEHPEFARLKFSVQEFRALAKDALVLRVLDELERAHGLGLKTGMGRFATLLDVIGLGGPFERKVSDAVHEMVQVRHAIAHRRGRADQRLLTACPWLQSRFPAGERIKLTREDVDRYAYALLDVNQILFRRALGMRGDAADETTDTDGPAVA
jgi:hypothetical protein